MHIMAVVWKTSIPLYTMVYNKTCAKYSNLTLNHFSYLFFCIASYEKFALLNNLLFQRSEYGTGIYFSSELGVSLPYSPVGYGWGASLLGSEISCIALCELINHPDIKRGDSSKRTIYLRK